LTDDDIIREHCAHLTRLNRRPGTIYQRLRTLERLRTFIEPTRLLDATIDQLRAYVTRGLGAEAAAGEVSRIRQFYRWAVIEGLLEVDPSVKLERPTRPKGVPRPMPCVDVERALAEAPEPLRTWFLLAVRAGLRACEIAPVRSRDVNGGLLIIPVQKGGGMGAVQISPGLAAALSSNIATIGWWFPHGTDPARHVTAAQVSKRANRWLHEHGIDHTLHSLRHRFGTDVYRLSGRDLLLTASLMRHVKLDTTKLYVQLENDRAASVVALLDDAA
jgi:site-specific recombinase XerD